MSIAYQVVGEGTSDLVFVPGWVSHVEHAWEEPSYAPFLHRMASFARLILLDRRGTGLSDPVDHLPTLEERMDDVRAVMDAAGSQRAYLFGISESGAMCILFAATYPSRTAGLLLCNTFARHLYADDYTSGLREEQWNEILRTIEKQWGTGITARWLAPSGADEKAFPTLVLHRRDERAVPVELGRYLARHIPGARLVEVAGIDHFPWIGDTDSMLDEVEQFVTGSRRRAEPDRILATVLFTDIVDSTRRLAELGDSRWQALLAQFYSILRGRLEQSRGREINTTGDGLFAAFDGPARAVRYAQGIRDAVAPLGIAIRTGIHTGECELVGDEVGGLAVHLGARVTAAAAPNEVLVSSTVKDLVAGSGLRFVDRGFQTLKGLPEPWRLYAVEG